MKFLHINQARHLNDFKIWVSFNDGTEGSVDLQDDLEGSIFEPLKDPEYFRSFKLEGHTLSWPNGADFAPEFIHSTLLHNPENPEVINSANPD